MCGRFNQTASGDEVAEAFALEEREALAPRYNICPTQKAAVVRLDPDTGRRGLVQLTWGLVPRSALGKERGHINARGESAWERPTFAEAFAERRCLVPATGFYEWQKLGAKRDSLPRSEGGGTGGAAQHPLYQKLDEKKRQPWLLRLAAPGPFAFAGLWEPASALPGAAPTFTILTTEPNDLARMVHDRMPVILEPGDYARWLDPDRVPAELRPLLRPFPAPAMTAYAVSTRVNSPANDDPGCLEPAQGPPSGPQLRLLM